MNTDILGSAIWDYYDTDEFPELWVLDTLGDPVEMDVSLYFRDIDEMPELELKALASCKGRVLDIGAGAGSHAIALEMKGHKVTALDISPICVKTMKARGADDARVGDIFEFETEEKYDTLLLMMNGIGLCGTLERLGVFLDKAKSLLNTDGQLIFDSSDVIYLFEDGDVVKPTEHYYGEIICAYEYKDSKTNFFKWLYIDYFTLLTVAESKGWVVEKLYEDETGQYLCQLTMCRN
jgi:SAM-dependent methyltransferase